MFAFPWFPRSPVSNSVQVDQEAASGAIWDVLAAAVGGSSRVASAPTEEALRIFLAVAFMVMFTVNANAKFLDGNTLRGWCFSEDVGNQAACLGYVIGVADVLISEKSGELTQYKACIPPIETTQVVDTAKQYLDTHRQSGDITASDLVAMALSEAFPGP